MEIRQVRVGSQGEYEQKFIQEKRIYDDSCLFLIPQEADLYAARAV